jgi:hypothetical protein
MDLHGMSKRAAFVLLAVVTAACGKASAPDGRTAADQAAFMEHTRCGIDGDDQLLAPVLSGSAVQKVEPLYSNLGSNKAGPQSQLRGATITIVALPGMTAEWLDRALECHSAKSTLGHARAGGDPFWLPGAIVDIDVRSARDGFDAAVTGYSSDDAQAILARATAFMASKPAAP